MSDGLFRRAPRTRRLLTSAIALALGSALAAAPSAHAAAPAHTQAPPVRNGSTLTQAQARAQAKASGKPVAVPAATTSTSTLTADPDGSFTLTQSLTPVRTRVGGAWKSLDATLVRNPDGTLHPAVATGALTLSGGGHGALATMRSTSGASMALSLPSGLALPAPHLSGSTATYPQLIPGVDLEVTADTQGGFSEVLVVQNAAAAADPRLRSLAFGIRTSGVAVSTDAAGNLTATDTAGRAVFTAPPARMWDSAAPAAGRAFATDPHTGARVDPASGRPLSSTSDQPGVAAHTADLKAAYHAGTLTLTPDRAILAAASASNPVYIDPSYTDNPTDSGNYTYVSSMYPTAKYWGVTTTKAVGPLHAGYIDDTLDSPNYISTDRTYLRLPLDASLYGASIQDATFSITENWSYSCTASTLDLYTTGDISSSTTWNTQPAQSTWTLQGQQSAAHGQSSTCPSSAIGYDLKNLIASQTASPSPPNHLTFMLKADNESDQNGWKQFYQTATLTTHYDHIPNTPDGLSTSGAPSCAAGATPIGKGNVTLNANVSDPDGGTVYAFFTLTNTATGATVASTSYQPATSGLYTSLTVPQATITADSGTTSVANYAWNVYLKDGTASDTNALPSPTSATCYFSYDPTSPGPPTIDDANGKPCNPDTTTVAYQTGTPATFTLTPSGSTSPAGYLYQLNGAAPTYTTAAALTVTPTRRTDTLTVTAQSAGGNLGTSATCILNATPAKPAADKDLTGDGTPDLLTVGGPGTLLPSGIYQATGQSTGQVGTTAVDIGANGIATAPAPGYFDATQAVTGRFTDTGVQDVLDYNPTTGNAVVLDGTGDGSVIESQDANNEQPILPGALTDSGNNLLPLQLANAYNADTGNTASNTNYPDLIATAGNTTTGYYLDYYESANQTGTWTSIDNSGDVGNTRTITHPTPAGDQAWNTWTIATTQINGSVEMYVWQPTTGALYLWAGVTVTDDANTLTATLSTTNQYTIADGTSTQWNKNPTPPATTLQTADINGDGTPDLWLVTTGGNATAYIASLSGTTVTLTAHTPQALITSNHAWNLNDYTTTAHTATDDTAGTELNLTGTGGVTATTGDPLFSPDVTLDGTTGYLSTTSAAVTPNADFTLSAWVKPTAAGGTVISQDGTNDSAFTVSLTTAGQWQIAMNNNATTTASYDTDAGTANLGIWTQLTLSYTASTRTLALYTDNTLTAALTATAAPSATGPLRLGANQTNNAITGYYTGQIADVQTWNSALTTKISPAVGTFGDVNGDGKPDLVAIDTSGNLLLYPNSGTGTGVNTFTSPPTQIGSGWTGFTLDAVADLNHAGRAGLLATDTSNGNLLYYPNTGTGTTVTFGAPTIVGTGWNPMRVIGLTDLYSTGAGDGILTVNTNDGTLLYYANTGGTGTNTFAGSTQVGSGWNSLTAVVGDVNNDGKPDVLALDTSGNLILYPNSGGTGLNTFTSPPTAVGSGLTGDKLIALSDPYTTGRNGYITVDTTNGNLYYTPNTGGTGLSTFGTPTLIGTGWNPYTIN